MPRNFKRAHVGALLTVLSLLAAAPAVARVIPTHSPGAVPPGIGGIRPPTPPGLCPRPDQIWQCPGGAWGSYCGCFHLAPHH
jgi:hypothetical protein